MKATGGRPSVKDTALHVDRPNGYRAAAVSSTRRRQSNYGQEGLTCFMVSSWPRVPERALLAIWLIAVALVVVVGAAFLVSRARNK